MSASRRSRSYSGTAAGARTQARTSKKSRHLDVVLLLGLLRADQAIDPPAEPLEHASADPPVARLIAAHQVQSALLYHCEGVSGSRMAKARA